MENLERLERILALMLIQQMKGSSSREKIIQLNLAGFSNVEIADILRTTTGFVSKEISEYKKKRTNK